MEQKHLSEDLIKKYVSGLATEEECAIVESWHLEEIKDSHFIPDPSRIESVNSGMRQRVLAHARHSRKNNGFWQRIAVAASITLVVSVGGYFFFHQQTKPLPTTTLVQHDIAPGGNKAVLTLSDGSKIPLDDVRKGELARQSGTSITKTNGGQLLYSSVNDAAPSARGGRIADIRNTLSTPKGGQYELILPDGTHVWLDAASSITFPVAFSGKDRAVTITGQAYFEVAHNRYKPFRVVSNNQVIEVLGTHFNVNAYADEPSISTTLLEGSVKVANLSAHTTNILKPGEQSILEGNNTAIITGNIRNAIAWKNSEFRFDNEKIESVMRKVSRWYNVQVEYKGEITREGFNGAITRLGNIGDVLAIMERSKAVHFKIEGRKIIVEK